MTVESQGEKEKSAEKQKQINCTAFVVCCVCVSRIKAKGKQARLAEKKYRAQQGKAEGKQGGESET